MHFGQFLTGRFYGLFVTVFLTLLLFDHAISILLNLVFLSNANSSTLYTCWGYYKWRL